MKKDREEIYKKWEKIYGPNTRLAIDITYSTKGFEKELGRIFLPSIVEHINNNDCFIIDSNNYVFFHFLKKKNKMKLSYILSTDKKGSILLEKLEKKCIYLQIPIITLTVVADVAAVDWYYKKGFEKVNERKSRKGTKLFDLEKRIKMKNILDF